MSELPSDAALRDNGITTFILSAPDCDFCDSAAWAYVEGLGACCESCARFRKLRMNGPEKNGGK